MSNVLQVLHCPPEVVCVKMAGELWIDVDDMHIALCGIADNGFVVGACCRVCLDVDTECAVEF